MLHFDVFSVIFCVVLAFSERIVEVSHGLVARLPEDVGVNQHVSWHRQAFYLVFVSGVGWNREGDCFPPANLFIPPKMFRGHNRVVACWLTASGSHGGGEG